MGTEEEQLDLSPWHCGSCPQPPHCLLPGPRAASWCPQKSASPATVSKGDGAQRPKISLPAASPTCKRWRGLQQAYPCPRESAPRPPPVPPPLPVLLWEGAILRARSLILCHSGCYGPSQGLGITPSPVSPDCGPRQPSGAQWRQKEKASFSLGSQLNPSRRFQPNIPQPRIPDTRGPYLEPV